MYFCAKCGCELGGDQAAKGQDIDRKALQGGEKASEGEWGTQHEKAVEVLQSLGEKVLGKETMETLQAMLLEKGQQKPELTMATANKQVTQARLAAERATAANTRCGKEVARLEEQLEQAKAAKEKAQADQEAADKELQAAILALGKLGGLGTKEEAVEEEDPLLWEWDAGDDEEVAEVKAEVEKARVALQQARQKAAAVLKTKASRSSADEASSGQHTAGAGNTETEDSMEVDRVKRAHQAADERAKKLAKTEGEEKQTQQGPCK